MLRKWSLRETGSRKDHFRRRFSGASQLALAKTAFVGASHQACRNWFSQRPLSWEPLSWALLRCVATGSRKGRFLVLFPGSSKLALANTAFVTFVCASQVCAAYTSRLLGPSHRYLKLAHAAPFSLSGLLSWASLTGGSTTAPRKRPLSCGRFPGNWLSQRPLSCWRFPGAWAYAGGS